MATANGQKLTFPFDTRINDLFGYVDSIDKVTRIITQLEDTTDTRFVRSKGRPNFGYTKLEDAIKKPFSIRWLEIRPSEKQSTQVRLENTNDLRKFKLHDDLPYMVAQSLVMVCHIGGRYTKSRIPEDGIRQRNVKSKKMGCTAKIFLREEFVFPDFRVLGKPSKCAKSHMSATLRCCLRNRNGKVRAERRIYIELPANSDHAGHQLFDGGLKLPIDPKIAAEIKRLVTEEHMDTVDEIRPVIRQFVRFSLCNDRPLPAETNRRYYPSTTTIRNYINVTKIKIINQSLQAVHQSPDQSPVRLELHVPEDQLDDTLNSLNSGNNEIVEQIMAAAKAKEPLKKPITSLKQLSGDGPSVHYIPMKQSSISIYPFFSGIDSWGQLNLSKQDLKRTKDKAYKCRLVMSELMDLTYLIRNEDVYNSLLQDLKTLQLNMEQYVDNSLLHIMKKAREDAVDKLKMKKKSQKLKQEPGVHGLADYANEYESFVASHASVSDMHNDLEAHNYPDSMEDAIISQTPEKQVNGTSHDTCGKQNILHRLFEEPIITPVRPAPVRPAPVSQAPATSASPTGENKLSKHENTKTPPKNPLDINTYWPLTNIKVDGETYLAPLRTDVGRLATIPVVRKKPEVKVNPKIPRLPHAEKQTKRTPEKVKTFLHVGNLLMNIGQTGSQLANTPPLLPSGQLVAIPITPARNTAGATVVLADNNTPIKLEAVQTFPATVDNPSSVPQVTQTTDMAHVKVSTVPSSLREVATPVAKKSKSSEAKNATPKMQKNQQQKTVLLPSSVLKDSSKQFKENLDGLEMIIQDGICIGFRDPPKQTVQTPVSKVARINHPVASDAAASVSSQKTCVASPHKYGVKQENIVTYSKSSPITAKQTPGQSILKISYGDKSGSASQSTGQKVFGNTKEMPIGTKVKLVKSGSKGQFLPTPAESPKKMVIWPSELGLQSPNISGSLKMAAPVGSSTHLSQLMKGEIISAVTSDGALKTICILKRKGSPGASTTGNTQAEIQPSSSQQSSPLDTAIPFVPGENMVESIKPVIVTGCDKHTVFKLVKNKPGQYACSPMSEVRSEVQSFSLRSKLLASASVLAENQKKQDTKVAAKGSSSETVILQETNVHIKTEPKSPIGQKREADPFVDGLVIKSRRVEARKSGLSKSSASPVKLLVDKKNTVSTCSKTGLSPTKTTQQTKAVKVEQSPDSPIRRGPVRKAKSDWSLEKKF